MEQPYKCAECGDVFLRKNELTNHQKVHEREKRFRSTECGESFYKRKPLIRHKNIHIGHGKSHNLLNMLITRQNVLPEAKPFTCKQCGRCFSKKDNLDMHEKIHTLEKVEKTCKECSKQFIQKCSPGWQKEEKPFTCIECEKKKHLKETTYKCTECGDVFSRRCNLTIHQKVHEKEKLFRRTKYGRSQMNTLAGGQNAHTVAKPLTCGKMYFKKDIHENVCGKMFIPTSSPKYQEECSKRNMPRESSYKCVYCGDRFYRKCNLMVHNKVHEREKQFRCMECGESFYNMKKLKRHRKIHSLGYEADGTGVMGNNLDLVFPVTARTLGKD
ncbi:hypothetical protein GDO86_011984 [Hymenochirus boettgeri]|uniref:C2H2-type domain-containing protein n=1 Tax=Hymenochirus boettgeri TaxID=247094 RepID=A0A8T2JDM2_9PIPI|nr:hypothetical protein GDO86_011984 [Hymenochirus boettgeri]